MRKAVFSALIAIATLVGMNTSAFACACCETWQVVNVPSNDVLNIRSGPGRSYTKVGSIPSGSACVIKTGSCKRRWCAISYADQKGWVSTRYLRFKN